MAEIKIHVIFLKRPWAGYSRRQVRPDTNQFYVWKFQLDRSDTWKVNNDINCVEFEILGFRQCCIKAQLN